MSLTFTKLFSSITESTVWCEPAGTRLVWITLLAKADRRGRIFASVPGLANLARVSLDECLKALETFSGPDPWSRTPDNDGRRIEAISGGWRLLNYEFYRELRDEEARREQNREAQRRKRSGDPSPGSVSKDADSQPPSADSSAQAEAEAEAEKQDQKLSARQAARFDDWWAVYPKKVGKKPARARWQARKLDRIADMLIADVRNRIENDDGWSRGFILDPCTYLNQDRWQDELRAAPAARASPTGQPHNGAAPSKSMQALSALEALKSHAPLATHNDRHRAPETSPALTGPDARR